MEVRGNAGNDTFEIRSGRVKINYRTSTQGIDVDLAAGRASNDGFGGVDTIIGDVRELEGGDGDDTIRGAMENVRASTGDDRIVYTDGSTYGQVSYSRLTIGGIRVTLNGGVNRATVDKGSAGTDTIVGVADLLGWYAGGFGIYGTSSNDVFNLTMDDEQWVQVGGGAGDDTFNIQADIGAGGYVCIDYRNAQNGIDVDLRAGTARNDGFGDVDTINGDVRQIRGSDFTDIIRGGDNNEHFIGRQGDDIIDGRGGFDALRFDRSCCATIRNLEVDLGAGTATGTWNGAAFNYTISSIEEVRSGDSDDDLVGSPGDDRLRGGEGEDFLEGGPGNDRLDGGDGEDTFYFEPGHGEDVISDFTDGEDTIVLRGFGVSKSEVLSNAGPWSDGIGVSIDLSGHGGGNIDLEGFDFNDLDESDFLL